MCSGGSALAGEGGTLPLGSVINNVCLSRDDLGSLFVTRNLEKKERCNESKKFRPFVIIIISISFNTNMYHNIDFMPMIEKEMDFTCLLDLKKQSQQFVMFSGLCVFLDCVFIIKNSV